MKMGISEVWSLLETIRKRENKDLIALIFDQWKDLIQNPLTERMFIKLIKH